MFYKHFKPERFVLLFRLTQSQSQHSEQNEGLHQRINELKSSLSSAQLDVSQWVARYDSLMEQHQNLDLTMTKLDNHCEVNKTSALQQTAGAQECWTFKCVCVVCLAAEPTKREPGGGEPPSAESDQPAESAEPHSAGEEHGEQRAVPPGAEIIHVTTCSTTSAAQTTPVTTNSNSPVLFQHINSDIKTKHTR